MARKLLTPDERQQRAMESQRRYEAKREQQRKAGNTRAWWRYRTTVLNNRSATIAGGHRFKVDEVIAIYERCGGNCYYCGKTVWPAWHGGQSYRPNELQGEAA